MTGIPPNEVIHLMNNESKQQEQDIIDILQDLEQFTPEDRTAQQAREKAELRARWEKAAQSQAPSPSDQELLRQCQGHDPAAAKQAFRQFVQRYKQHVYTYLMAKVDEQTAFEMTRAVFVQAYRHLKQFPADTAIKTWLLTIAREKRLKVSRKSEETWYLRLFPLPLYQWYVKRRHPDELSEDSPAAATDTCALVRGQLSAFIDNELPSTETEHLEAHLAFCLGCAQEYDRLLDTIELARSSKLISAPANLLPAINAVLDQDSLFDRILASIRRFVNIVPAPVFHVATLTLGIAVILLGLVNSSRQGYIQELEYRNARLRSTVRSLEQGEGQETMLNTFVIFTGTTVSEKMPPEAAQFVDTLLPDPKKSPRSRMISGTIARVQAEMETFLKPFQATITEKRVPHKTLNILKLTTALPQNSRSLFSLFLQGLEPTPSEADPGTDSSTTSFTIYIIDTL